MVWGRQVICAQRGRTDWLQVPVLFWTTVGQVAGVSELSDPVIAKSRQGLALPGAAAHFEVRAKHCTP